jgi:uncharacterized caspase-like protein
LGRIPDERGALAFSRDGLLLAFQESARVRIWDTLKGRELPPLKTTDPAASTTTTCVGFSAGGQLVATGGINRPTVVFDLKSGKQVLKLSGRTNPASEVAFSSDGAHLFSGERTIWDLKTGRGLRLSSAQADSRLLSPAPSPELIAAIDPKGLITHSALSADGQLLAASSADSSVSIWNAKAQQELRTLSGVKANVNSLAFNPNTRLLASACDDGSTLLWDTETGELLLTLISLDDGSEWIAITPQGIFDGTPTSWNQILWRYNQDTFNVAPIEWFFTEFYHPGLLADIFAGKRPRVADDVSRKDRRQPLVKLSFVGPRPEGASSSRTVKVKIEITDAPPDKANARGTGARDLRLFRNGLLVKSWSGDLLNGNSGATLEYKVPITAGINRLTAYAFNRDNVKSKDAVLAVTGAESLRRSGIAYIIAIGINEYANPQYNLKYAAADAESFAEELRQRIPQVAHFDHIEVVSLLNEHATKANIISSLQRLSGTGNPSGATNNLRRVEPEDTVVIYFAGHGTANGQRFYLIPHDLGYMGDRTALDDRSLQSILTHSISDLELEQAVEGMDAGHLLLFIDACNSGQALEAEEKRRGPMNSKGLAQLAYEKGMYILTAAQSYQAAIEAARLGHGLLTYALVEEGLKTSAADNEPADGIVTARELLDFATERVPQIQEEKMKESRGIGLGLAFVDGEQNIADPQQRGVQRPRVFYRRELEGNPLVVARSGNASTAIKTTPSAANGAPSGVSRWFDLQTATVGARYRFIENSRGVTVTDQVQSFAQFKGRFKFDRAGNYSINAGVFTGNGFVVGFNDTGIGTGDLMTNLYLKQLYFSAKPARGVEVQFGGLYFNRGESTEITTYDNDGYLMGERIVVQRPRSLFFDEISATYGFLGDLSTPNINKRWNRLKKSNYHQFLVSKRIGDRANISTDYTFESGRDTLRQALRVNTPEFKPLDFFRVEVYERVQKNPEAGLAAYGEKGLLKKRLTLGGGYAQIDPFYGGLNGDRYNIGRRVFFQSTYKLTPEFNITTFYTRGFKNAFPISNQTRFEIFVTYNLLKFLKF